MPDSSGAHLPAEKSRKTIEALVTSILAEGFYQDKPLAGYVAMEEGASLI